MDLDRFQLPEGDYPCPGPGCGAVVHGPRGTRCPPCAEAYAKAAFDRLARERCLLAHESIPPTLRWATLDAPAFGDRRDRLHTRAMLAVAREVVAERCGVVLVGGGGAGKSSLAVKIFDAHLAAAHASGDERRLERAATSRFVMASELVAAAAEHRLGAGPCPDVVEATRADVLVLDEFGLEPVHPMMLTLLKRRRYDGRVTIVTTPLRAPLVPGTHATDAERCAMAIEARYGEGSSRAIFERAEVITFGGHGP